MMDDSRLAIATIIGFLLGGIYFLGLWFTVTKCLQSKYAGLWFLISMVLRTAFALAGFFFVLRWGLSSVVASLIGFTVARLLSVRATAPKRRGVA